ncbi:MAG: PilZ domain-containing protein [bacterium]|nr:PilZ domain-containing protein [bacterium]
MRPWEYYLACATNGGPVFDSWGAEVLIPPPREALEDTMADERRNNTRYDVEGIRGSFLFTTGARVLNLSLDGMSLETNNPLKIGHEYSLRLDEGKNQMPLKGTVVWCTLVKTTRDSKGDVQPVFRAGVHFADIMSGKANELRSFIHKNAVISLENRLFGRFRIEAARPADLSLEAEFTVRQISLSGMLVETEVAPPIDTECQLYVEVSGVKFEATARIVRVERQDIQDDSIDKPVFLAIEFIELSEDSMLTLESFIGTALH